MQQQDVINHFRKCKLKQWVVSVPLMLAAIPLVMMDLQETRFGMPGVVLFSICIVVVLAGLIFSVLNWRCPSCNNLLGNELNPKFCAQCGVKLQ